MATYAVIESDTVENVIVCDSKELAESVTGKTCVEYTDENPAGIGWTYNYTSKIFTSPSPYPSWILNVETNSWEAPTPRPEGGSYVWNEESLSWIEDLSSDSPE